jgi:serine/threonine-protein kinase
MSRVYRGWIRGSGLEVAVKVLRDDLASRPEAVQRFVRERDLLQAVASPHVVRVHDLVIHGDELAIVMDLVPGGHLRRALTFPLLPATAVELAAQVADGLAAVHAAGVVHRDLKPENVLVDTGGGPAPRLRLTDFGISRLSEAQLTQTSVTGTPGYLAPEVAAGGRVTAAADVYALGVILYELCTGRGPFLADNPLVLVLAHTRQQPPRPTGMPEPLWSLLSGMLAKDPTARPTAAQLAPALRRLAPELVGLQPFPVPDLPPAEAIAPLPPAVRTGDQDGRAGSERPRTPGASWPATPPQGHGPYTLLSPSGPTGSGPTGSGPTGSGPRRDRTRRPEGMLDRIAARWASGGGPRAVLFAAAAAGLVLAGGIVVYQLTRSPNHVSTSIAPDPAPPSPTGPPSPTPSQSAATPSTSPTRTPRSVVPISRPTPTPSPTPSPDVPTLSLVPADPGTPPPAGTITLAIGKVKANTGTISSITVRWAGGSQKVPVQNPAPAGYQTTITGLTAGTAYSFTAQVCNSTGKCATSAALAYTPSGAPTLQPPQGKATGLNITITWAPLVRNGQQGTATCTLTVVGTPADPAAPKTTVPAEGGSQNFTGKPNTSYRATETCTVTGALDATASSDPIVTGAGPAPTPGG